MPNASLTKIIRSYINGGEGGLFGRILAEVMSAFGLYTRPRSRLSHTDQLSSVNLIKMFIIWQTQEQFNLFNVTGLY